VKLFNIKWIDFGHMDQIKEDEKDTGLIHGLNETIKMIEEIKNEWWYDISKYDNNKEDKIIKME
jgi:hypothetical protein